MHAKARAYALECAGLTEAELEAIGGHDGTLCRCPPCKKFETFFAVRARITHWLAYLASHEGK